MLDTLIANAVKLAGAKQGHIRQHDGEYFRAVAHYGESPELVDTLRTNPIRPAPDTQLGREFLTRKPLHILDARLDPDRQNLAARTGARTLLVVPLLREDSSIGGITIWRDVVDPFTDRQIELVKTFADQAVIAIENVRLFQELTESLEQQTATSEILGVIASSPTDIQPVLDTVAANAARLCEANDAQIYRVEGALIRKVAIHGDVPSHLPLGETRPLTRGSVSGRAVLDREMVHFHDMWEARQEDFPDVHYPTNERLGLRTFLSIPLLREGVAIGVITIRRREVQPFTEKQIALVKTFADQAVIAIENVRLFQELQVRNRDLTEALEQQTATSEILRVIASSPTELQTVMDTIAENAARLCDADDVLVRRTDGVTYQTVAHYGSIPHSGDNIPVDIGSGPARAILERRTIHVHDIQEAESEFPGARLYAIPQGIRTVLSVPLLRDGVALGILHLRRLKVQPFTDNQISLLKTFADQAVIAIENVRLFKELQDRNRDLTEALEQQTATSEILSVIASSPTDIQPVLDVVAENAARLSGSDDAQIYRVEADLMRKVASYGIIPTARVVGDTRPIVRGTVSGRAILERQIIHIRDMTAERDEDYPEARRIDEQMGIRASLAVPLLREGVAVGVILIRRTEVRPFTEKQIALLKTFADQAVIAIENVRLFKELGERNAELREALEYQTATAEVLGIISRSPTDVQPVLEAIVESAARVCGIDDVSLRLHEGNKLVARAHFGPIPIPVGRVEMSLDEPWFRWMREHGTLHVPDARAAQNDFPTLGALAGFRTFLGVPLHQQEEFVGILTARRNEVRPFTPAQIKLLETFADQAVIAIENVRLFQELKESLEQQTATSEILGVIASSPTDIQPVLDVVAENAARLCDATDAVIHRIDGDKLRPVANYGPLPGRGERGGLVPIDRDTIPGRAIIDRRTLHIDDLAAVPESDLPARFARSVGVRTVLATPLLREAIPIGAIQIRRMEVRPFTDKQVKLLETFAAQAVIAIENVRLFQELKESLEQQTATSEILGVIASSPTDIQPVLDVVAENAARLCDAFDALILRVDGDTLRDVAKYGSVPTPGYPLPVTRGTPVGRAVTDRQTIHVHDLTAEVETEFLESKTRQEISGSRTCLATPLLREGIPIGAIVIRRTEVRPFSDKQIKLLETFADQAVIAIENVRLFQELEARTRELAQSVGELRALGAVSQAVSSTLDLETVLSTIASHAVQLSGTDCGVIYEYDEREQEFDLRASHRMEDGGRRDPARRADPPGRGSHRPGGDDARAGAGTGLFQ